MARLRSRTSGCPRRHPRRSAGTSRSHPPRPPGGGGRGGTGGGAACAPVIANAGSEALLDPSLTLITIPGSVPTFAAEGVPASWPVAESKFAQAGLAAIAKVNFAPLAALALGRNMYALETIAWVAGVPEM